MPRKPSSPAITFERLTTPQLQSLLKMTLAEGRISNENIELVAELTRILNLRASQGHVL